MDLGPAEAVHEPRLCDTGVQLRLVGVGQAEVIGDRAAESGERPLAALRGAAQQREKDFVGLWDGHGDELSGELVVTHGPVGRVGDRIAAASVAVGKLPRFGGCHLFSRLSGQEVRRKCTPGSRRSDAGAQGRSRGTGDGYDDGPRDAWAAFSCGLNECISRSGRGLRYGGGRQLCAN
jgi:hypothetical protein